MSLHYTARLMWFSSRASWLFYQLLVAVGMALAAPFLWVRRGRHYLPTLTGRLGLYPGAKQSAQRVSPRGRSGRLWIHAVSVGEVAIAATLVRRLPKDLPLVITTVTPTGQERARALFDSSEGQREVAYLPFDIGFSVKRFYERFAPTALVLVEGDYWPLILEFARRRRVPVAVINGRVGERSGRRLARIPRLARQLFFEGIDRFAVQTAEDQRRLIAGGASADRIQITGNLKFDAPTPPSLPDLEAEIQRLASGRPILLAGSTMGGEEEKVLDAFVDIGAGKSALLLLAPRHPERFEPVARRIQELGLVCLRRSRLDQEQGEEGVLDVLLLDSLGELAALYRIASVAFIGGTLVTTGGHNPLEPASFSVPIVVGLSMDNFREIAGRFDDAGAWARVADAGELARLWRSWLADPEAARSVGRKAADLLAANRGALEATLKIIQPLLPESVPSSD